MKKVALLGMFAVGAFAENWTGTIVDKGCGAKHAAATEKDQACTKSCIGKGSDPVFVVDGKVIEFADPKDAKLTAHYGHKVVIDGDLKDGKVVVKKVTMPAS